MQAILSPKVVACNLNSGIPRTFRKGSAEILPAIPLYISLRQILKNHLLALQGLPWWCLPREFPENHLLNLNGPIDLA